MSQVVLYYGWSLYNPVELVAIVEAYADELRTMLEKHPNIGTVVSTGSSGTVLCTALQMRKEFRHLQHVHVSKEPSHGGKVKGNCVKDAIFIDDFIETGASLPRCCNALANQTVRYALVSKPHRLHDPDVQAIITQNNITVYVTAIDD